MMKLSKEDMESAVVLLIVLFLVSALLLDVAIGIWFGAGWAFLAGSFQCLIIVSTLFYMVRKASDGNG